MTFKVLKNNLYIRPFYPLNKFFNFSLVELLIVLVIFSILNSLLFPVFKDALKAGQKISCQTNLKSILNAIHLYGDDYVSLLPKSSILNGHPTATNHGYNRLTSVGGDDQYSGLGALLDEGYLNNGRTLFCSVESDWTRKAFEQKSDQMTVEGCRQAVSNGNFGWWFSSYVYRGHVWRDGVRQPAHGPALPTYSSYIDHLYKRPCSISTCGSDDHGVLAILADTFTRHPIDYPTGRGYYYHQDFYNVGYTDGHVESISDPSLSLVDYIPKYYSFSSHNYMSYRTSEDAWDAFDGDIGRNAGSAPKSNTYGNYIYDLK